MTQFKIIFSGFGNGSPAYPKIFMSKISLGINRGISVFFLSVEVMIDFTIRYQMR